MEILYHSLIVSDMSFKNATVEKNGMAMWSQWITHSIIVPFTLYDPEVLCHHIAKVWAGTT